MSELTKPTRDELEAWIGHQDARIEALCARLAGVERERDAWKVDASNSYGQIQDLGKQLASLTRRWTTARPTVAGWYWCRSADAISKWPDLSPVIVQVVVLPTTNALTILWAAQNQPVTHYNGTDEWAGPIQMPQEGTHP